MILADDDARRAPRAVRRATSPTAPTTSSASTTCATTWRGRSRSCVQRGHNFAIVDEVDSILIDEARTPLIISRPGRARRPKWYAEFAKHRARGCAKDVDYEVDEKKRTVGVLEPGIAKVEDHLGIDNLYESVNTPLIGYLNNAIKAKELFKQRQGLRRHERRGPHRRRAHRPHAAGRRYNEGMHQAIEAKEGVEIKEENQTLATITLQNYFRLYDKLSGMTGTADDRGRRVRQDLQARRRADPDQQADDPRRPGRPRLPDRGGQVRRRRRRHRRAAREGPAGPGRHRLGREVRAPLRSCCASAGVPHEVLNAKQHEREATIVAQAGRKGAVTVATNMAGRGTDIMLGGNAEFLADAELRAARASTRSRRRRSTRRPGPRRSSRSRQAVAAEHDEVVELGGLYVLGTERHESRRIDNQLRGRSGRQGDPGESRFYLSLEDDLMRLFNAGAGRPRS